MTGPNPESPGLEDWFPVSKETIAEIRTIIAKDVPAVRDVVAERQRQVEQEGWSPEHDDAHDDGELSRAIEAHMRGDEK